MPTVRSYADDAARQRAYRERQRQAREQERSLKGLPAAPSLATLPGERRWDALLVSGASALATALSEMQAYHAARSATWQESERGDALSERMEQLEMLLTDLQDLQGRYHVRPSRQKRHLTTQYLRTQWHSRPQDA